MVNIMLIDAYQAMRTVRDSSAVWRINTTPLPPVKWIIPGLLPAGLALFAGPSKAGKSWLTLWLCLQIA